MQNPPFYYKVSFHFLAQDQDNELRHESWQKEFHQSDPYKARKEAFEAFDDYLNNLRINGKIEIDSYGNPKIISPSGIPEEPDYPNDIDSLERKDLLELAKLVTSHMEFEETLDVLLVITDESLMEAVNEVDYVLAIHSISSHSVPKQVILDGLATEVDLYEKAGYNPFDHTVAIQHFGEDFAESGEEEGEENYTILPTPFKWTTREQYEDTKQVDGSVEELTEDNFWESVLKKGESNTLEFKPSLVYNFLPGAPNYLPLFNNARTICGFLNSNGGILLIGVSDNGDPQGIAKDLEFLGSRDKIRLKVDQMISSYFDNSIASLIDVSFEEMLTENILVVKVKPSSHPIFLKNYNPIKNTSSKHFYVRRSASTTEVKDVEEIIGYVFNHWGKN